ncbi:hypothetical protein [Paraburkholderia sp. BL6669N2]|uniref:hypothetical protein n=1 Tax=Paraburkholderia sp. BL6669N2 TaxID=1938807 RepID=UPI0011C073F4|nr:hypothetical protein [Paraburkholderia sp. BL6669N2]
MRSSPGNHTIDTGKTMPVSFLAYKGLKKIISFDDEVDAVENGNEFVTVYGHPWSPFFTEGLDVNARYVCAERKRFFLFDDHDEFVDWVMELSYLVGCEGKIPAADSKVAFRDIFRSGNGGMIGPVASAKLVCEFDKWDDRVRLHRRGKFYKHYLLMRNMFEYASVDGAVNIYG